MSLLRPANVKIRALLLDLSGTLHIGTEATPSAVQALERVRQAKIPVRFCSNTSKECTSDLRERLKEIGFDVHDNELWTSLGALKATLEVRKLKRPYCLLSESAMNEFPEYTYVGDTTNQNLKEFDSVVMGLAPELLNYDHLSKAFRILNSSTNAQPKPLITTHRARYVRTPDGDLSLGPGPFVAALEHACASRSEVQAISVGKPGKPFFERVLASLSDDPLYSPSKTSHGLDGEGLSDTQSQWSGVAIVGDDIEADLGEGASELGLWRVLVKTGKYQHGDENREGNVPPDEVHESFASFIDRLLSDHS